MNTEQQHGDIRWQFNLVPRWLLYSGLPQALGPIRWAVFQALVQVDHQTMGLDNRRRGKDKVKFAVGNEELSRISAVADPRRAIRFLRTSTKLLSYWRPGIGGALKGRAQARWSEYEVNRKTLLELYRYVAPRLTVSEGGVQTLAQEKPPLGMLVYGLPNPNRMDIPGLKLKPEAVAGLRDAGIDIEDPVSLGEVRRICGVK